MNNILFYELFNNYDYSTYIDWSSIFVFILYLYYITKLNGLIYRTYLLHLWIGLGFVIKDGLYNIKSLTRIILSHADYNISELIAQQKYLSRFIDTLSDNNINDNILIRTGEIQKYNNIDLFVYKNIDITKLIPNSISHHRWEYIINEIEHIINVTHNNLLYNEIPIIINDTINRLNYIINPWNDNYIIKDLLIPIIKIPINYTINNNNEYIEITKYINISLLSLSIIVSYILHLLVKKYKSRNNNT
jgi:hypothetical protein